MSYQVVNWLMYTSPILREVGLLPSGRTDPDGGVADGRAAREKRRRRARHAGRIADQCDRLVDPMQGQLKLSRLGMSGRKRGEMDTESGYRRFVRPFRRTGREAIGSKYTTRWENSMCAGRKLTGLVSSVTATHVGGLSYRLILSSANATG